MQFDRSKRIDACTICRSPSLEEVASAEAGWWDDDVDGAPQRRRFIVDLGVCNDCGHGQALTALTAEEVSSMYRVAEKPVPARNDETFLSQIGTRYSYPHLDLLDDHLDETARVVDIGCNLGILLGELKLRYNLRTDNLLGVDYFPGHLWDFPHLVRDMNDPKEVVAFAREHAAAFDLVTLTNVLEHVIDPSAFLRAISAVLPGRGRLLIEVPNSTEAPRAEELLGTSIVHPQHLQYFTEQSLAMVLRMCGFDVHRQRSVARFNYQAQQILGVKRGNNATSSARPYLLACRKIFETRRARLARTIHDGVVAHGHIGLWGAGTELMQLLDGDAEVGRGIASGEISVIDTALAGKEIFGVPAMSLEAFLRSHPNSPVIATLSYSEAITSMRAQAAALNCTDVVWYL